MGEDSLGVQVPRGRSRSHQLAEGASGTTRPPGFDVDQGVCRYAAPLRTNVRGHAGPDEWQRKRSVWCGGRLERPLGTRTKRTPEDSSHHVRSDQPAGVSLTPVGVAGVRSSRTSWVARRIMSTGRESVPFYCAALLPGEGGIAVSPLGTCRNGGLHRLPAWGTTKVSRFRFRAVKIGKVSARIGVQGVQVRRSPFHTRRIPLDLGEGQGDLSFSLR